MKKNRFFYWLFQCCTAIFVLASNIWLSFALWVHKPFGNTMTWAAIAFWTVLTFSLIGLYIKRVIFSRKTDIFIYLGCLSIGLIWFFSMQPQNYRE